MTKQFNIIAFPIVNFLPQLSFYLHHYYFATNTTDIKVVVTRTLNGNIVRRTIFIEARITSYFYDANTYLNMEVIWIWNGCFCFLWERWDNQKSFLTVKLIWVKHVMSHSCFRNRIQTTQFQLIVFIKP